MAQTDDWGGVLVAEPAKDDWGGIAVDAPKTDDWGGVEVGDQPVPGDAVAPKTHPDRAEEIANAPSTSEPLPLTPYQGEIVPTTSQYIPSLNKAPVVLSPLDPVADAALREREKEMGIAPFSLGPEGKQDAIGEHLAAQARTPFVEIPKPDNTGVASGIARGVIGAAEGLETPENLGLLGGMSGASKGVQQLMSAGFGGLMVTNALEQFEAASKASTPGERAEGYTNAVLSLVMGGLAAKHATGRTPISAIERTASMEAARDKVSNAGVAAEATPTITPTALDAAAPAPISERPIAEPAGAESARTPAGEALTPETPNATLAGEASKAQVAPERTPLPQVEQASPASLAEGSKAVEARSMAAEELLPEQAEVAAPKLDMKRSPFALGISPDSKALNWLGANVKRLFTAKGDLPKETFEGWIQRNGYVKEQSRQTAYATRDLYGALRDEFGISKTEELTQGFKKVPPEFVKQMNQALLGEVDINTLPERVRAPLQAMRSHVDAMSKTMLDEGVVPAELQVKVADNLGTYLTRSYRVFDDPKWSESIPQDVRNRANDFILSNLRKENPSATPENARAVMNGMLQDWKDQGSGTLVKTGGKVGSKDLSSFIARKDIPQVLREAMGEYHDPLVNYTRSVTKMANLVGSQRFLNQVREGGMGKFLFEDGKQPASHSALIAAEGSDVMAPLNGLRTTPEIATAFREFGKSDPIKNGLLRAFATLSGVAKSVKTVGSLMTQARNALGQTYFFAMNGHFDMTQAAPAVKAVLADLGAKDTPTGRAAYQRYLRLGIVDQSAKASELRDIISDSGLNDPGVSLTEPGQIWAKTAKKLTVDAAAKAYQVTDDLGKIIGFENELARQREIHPEWSETTLEAASAERIRNTYPTYSMVPEGVKKIRRLPVAPFASFASETFRTAYHNLRYTVEDLQSSNPAQKKAGAQRLAGQLAVVGSGYAMSAASQALLGMNAQDEEDAKRFMPPWDKDSQIMFTDKGDGTAKYVNLSYVNPYSYLTDPVVAVAGGLRDADQIDEVMLRSLGKLLQPFTSEDIMAGAIVDVLRNKTQTGQRVFNPGDTPAKRWEVMASHLLRTLEPGTVTRFKSKIVPAIKGETDRTGRHPELTTEVLNELTGFKQQNLDYAQAVGFKAREFKKSDDDAETIFSEVAGRRGSVQPDEIVDAYKRATRSKFAAWQNFYRDVEAARRRGVKEGAIRTAVEARGVSGAEAGAVMSGRFIPPRVSPALGKQMKDAKRVMPEEAVNEMRRAEKLVLSGKFAP